MTREIRQQRCATEMVMSQIMSESNKLLCSVMRRSDALKRPANGVKAKRKQRDRCGDATGNMQNRRPVTGCSYICMPSLCCPKKEQMMRGLISLLKSNRECGNKRDLGEQKQRMSGKCQLSTGNPDGKRCKNLQRATHTKNSGTVSNLS